MGQLSELQEPGGESALHAEVASFYQDPLSYCMWAFPWDSDPSIQLCRLKGRWARMYPNCEYGPDEWQCEFLNRLGELIRERGFDPSKPANVMPIQMARASGHGIGKSALTGMLASFILDTRQNSLGTITANTGPQLTSKTWPAIEKWKRLAKPTLHWWDILGTMKIRNKSNPSGWFLAALAWRKEMSEAFAGQHEAGSTSWYIFDEGSATDDKIYEVSEGGLTDGEPMRFIFGNPTRNQGFFHRIFHSAKLREIFDLAQIDSRDCAIPNHELHKQWIETFGEDSDFVRVRVKGVFPRHGTNQLISSDVVRLAQLADPTSSVDDPLVMGIDVAWSGSAESVVALRRGNDSRSLEWRVYRGLDPTQLASRAAEYCNDLRRRGLEVARIFVDSTGIGAGTFSHLKHLGYPATEVNFGSTADDVKHHKNKAAEMWIRMRDWMKAGGAIPNDETLGDQLASRNYFHTTLFQTYLQPKDAMVKDGLESPDRGDALALTFAYHVNPMHPTTRARLGRNISEYDPVERFEKQTSGDSPHWDYDVTPGVDEPQVRIAA